MIFRAVSEKFLSRVMQERIAHLAEVHDPESTAKIDRTDHSPVA
jgi:hypothetical protein